MQRTKKDRERITLDDMEKKLNQENTLNDSLIVQVTVYYKEMHSALEINLSEYANEDHYLQVIKSHVTIAKHIIDAKLEKLNE